MSKLCFLVPGDWSTPTGGYAYDRRMVQALREAGWVVDVRQLPGAWPQPDAEALNETTAIVAALPDGALVVADGLAFGAMAAVAQAHAQRLRWVALVHHPLHMETGLDEATRHRLLASESSALQCAAQVVVTSRSTVQDVVAMGVPLDHIAVVEPGTDRQVLRVGRMDRSETVRLLCVATVTPRKGHAVLLQALAGLGHLAWELHNVGSLDRDPELASRVQAMSDEGVLAGRVFWHDAVNEDALQAHYAQADLFVLPSLHEGYGMVVVEAVSHGLPVLTTTAGALAHTLPPGAGLQVPPGDAAALREALGKLMADPDLRGRLRDGAQAAAQELPDWEHQAAILARALNQHKAAEGFSTDWLSLRETFDFEARNLAALRMQLVERLQHWRTGGDRPWRIIDLGCGTGSNLRWLAPRLGRAQQWLAVDHDAALLNAWPEVFQAAGAPLLDAAGDLAQVARWPLPSAPVQIVRRQLDLAQHLEALPWPAADLLTASALIDLVGEDWLNRLVACCSAARAGLLLTLSVDGRHQWHPADRDDKWVSHAFAAHQRRDKGLGAALGAGAVPVLVRLLREAGYRVFQARSDWQVDAKKHSQGPALIEAMVDGMAQAAQEQLPAATQRVQAWQTRRQASGSGSWLTVGHVDVLALPLAR